MTELLTLILLLAGAAVIFQRWYSARVQNRSRRRFDRALLAQEPVEPDTDEPREAQPLLRRHRLLPGLIGAAMGAAAYLLMRFNLTYSATGGLVVALLGWQIEAWVAERRMQKIESQLADAIDLMVGALRAGAGVVDALENAVQESRPPLAEQLDEVAARIRYGDAPQAVFRSLARRVPLETFLLFSSALSVHWEVGGSLAPTLATVGRTVRDRIELGRRIRSMSTQSRVSILAVTGVTYAIALLMWNNDSERMEGFLSTSIGSFFVASAVLLQAAGIAWSSMISRAKF